MSVLENYVKGFGTKTVAFIGAGVAHRQLIPLFVKYGADVVLCDKKEKIDNVDLTGVSCCLGANYLDGLDNADVIFRTPGFMYTEPAIQKALKRGAIVTSEMEAFFELCPAKIYAVTGSDGKTTTTSLIAAMLEKSGKTVHLGGNIGRAMLPIVDEVGSNDVAVCELSSFQLMSMHHRVDVAVVTNITPNHLDHHTDMQEYIESKRNIITYQDSAGVAVVGQDNDISRSFKDSVKGALRCFSIKDTLDNGGYLQDEILTINLDGVRQEIVAVKDVKLPGRHNIENLLAAFTAVYGDVPFDIMADTARKFSGVEHRIEFVREIGGVKYYNDSIASSPTRVIAGLHAFKQKLIVIAGGYDKFIPYEPLAPELIKHAKAVVLMGDTGPKIEKALLEHSDYDPANLPIYKADGMEQAVATATQIAQAGDIVTLSPASASFDCYDNFEKRGEHFKGIVNSI